jgi:acyl-CoA thioester hydrolase
MPVHGDLDIRVRYSECDPMGFAHHAAYPVWLEMGRTELLRRTALSAPSPSGRGPGEGFPAGGSAPIPGGRVFSYRELESRGTFIVVVKLEVNYRRPAKYDDLLRLRTAVARITRVKLEHEYSIFRGEELLTTAATTLACIDREGRVIEVPEFLRGMDDGE